MNWNMKSEWTLLFLASLCCLYTIYLVVSSCAIYAPQKHEGKCSVKSRRRILFGTSFWKDKTWEIGEGSAVFEGCPVSDCHLTADTSLFESSDAVLFHANELGSYPERRRPASQRWIFFNLESPQFPANPTYAEEPWKSAFNWTMTYRLDSDIPIPYGYIREASRKPKIDYLAAARSKKKLVAWFASNCRTASERERYVAELAKYIPVDVYGRCGNMTCTREYPNGDVICHKLLNETYFFYLSFENSLCADYITEKFYKILELVVVPVVRGGIGNEYSRIAKRNWYIDTRDFVSPKALASYLIRLSANLTEYVSFFNEKESYEVGAYYGLRKLRQWCQLCGMLSNKDQDVRRIEDITAWWSTLQCDRPKDILRTDRS